MLAKGHYNVHYSKMEFTYDGKEKAECIEWTEKNINEEITIYLQWHLTSKSITPSAFRWWWVETTETRPSNLVRLFLFTSSATELSILKYQFVSYSVEKTRENK
jgi:hypothetical protein